MNRKQPTLGILTASVLIVIICLSSLLWPANETNAAAAAGTVNGDYRGTVIVKEPVALGTMDLVFTLTSNGNNLTGQVNAAQTQVFLGGPALAGSVTVGEGITPTIRLESATFNSQISGRTVQRSFVLDGEIHEGGTVLQGSYIETITGFTPEPLQIKGTFFVARPAYTELPNADAGDEPTPTPSLPATATPSATTTPSATPTVTATATPSATPTVTATATGTATVTATPTFTASPTPPVAGTITTTPTLTATAAATATPTATLPSTGTETVTPTPATPNPTATATPPGGSTEPDPQPQFLYLPGVMGRPIAANSSTLEMQETAETADGPEVSEPASGSIHSLYVPAVAK